MKLCVVVALSLVTICSTVNKISGRTSNELRVSLPNGSKLVGRYLRSHDGNGIRAFMGIPYAEPPIHDLRFRVSFFLFFIVLLLNRIFLSCQCTIAYVIDSKRSSLFVLFTLF